MRILIFLITVLLVGCQSPGTGADKQAEVDGTGDQDRLASAWQEIDSLHVNFESVLSQGSGLLLSDIAEDIEYIALETNPAFIIGESSVEVKLKGEWILVGQHGKPVGLFDQSGKFSRNIGQIGKGPGEINFDYLFWPDPTDDLVWVWNADAGTIMGFSLEGERVYDIHPETKPGFFVPMGNGKFLSWTFWQQEFEDRYFHIFFHDLEGATYSRVYEPYREFVMKGRGISVMMPTMVATQWGYLFNSWKEELIYFTDSSGTFKPVLTWELGKYKMPFDPTEDYGRYQREKDQYIMDVSAAESRSRFFLRFYHKGRLQMAVVDKSTGAISLAKKTDQEGGGLWNDIDGGPSLWPSWDTEDGIRFYKLVQAFEFIDPEFKPDVDEVKDSEAAAALAALKATLTAESNPVVMIVEVK